MQMYSHTSERSAAFAKLHLTGHPTAGAAAYGSVLLATQSADNEPKAM